MCWVTEMQLPVVWRNIEPSLNARVYVEEIDNRPVAHLPNLDAAIFTDHNGQTAQAENDGGPLRWNISGTGRAFLPSLDGVTFTSVGVTVNLAATADPTLYDVTGSVTGTWRTRSRAVPPSRCATAGARSSSGSSVPPDHRLTSCSQMRKG